MHHDATVSAAPFVGRSLPRLEDAALLTGRGRFADDLGTPPGTLHAAVLRSPHAHAELLHVTVDAALMLPGVRAVLTGDDVRRWQQPFVVGTTLYALPEQKLGQIPGSGGSARLQKMVGITRTKDIVMRSRRISGPQAHAWGVATDCVPDAELESATDALVDELRGFSPIAQRTAKKLLNDTEDAPLSIAIELEGHGYSRLRSADDFREGVEAFHAKRKPKFTGR